MDSKLRRLEVTIGHSYRGIMTQVEELLAQASVTRTFGKRKYDAIKSEHRATMEVIQNDVASQQNADLSALWADTAAQNSARVKLEPQQVSFVSRLSKSFQDIVFFFALNTWTSDAVALPDSEKIFMVRVTSPFLINFRLTKNRMRRGCFPYAIQTSTQSSLSSGQLTPQ